MRPISFKKPLDVMTMQKKQSPFFSPNLFLEYPDAMEQNDNLGYESEAKKPGNLEVEISEPIVRPVAFTKPVVITFGKIFFSLYT